MVALLGIALRAVNLTVRPLSTDEPIIVGRALAVAQGGLVPPAFDYPSLPAYLVGGVLRAVAVVRPSVLTDELEPYILSRLLFVAVSGVLIVLVGLLGPRKRGKGPSPRAP